MTRRTGSIVARPNPIRVSGAAAVGATTLAWTASDDGDVEVRVGSADGALVSRSGPSGRATTGEWVKDGTTFFLQDASAAAADPAALTLATVAVAVRQARRERLRRYYGRLRDRRASKGLILLLTAGI